MTNNAGRRCVITMRTGEWTWWWRRTGAETKLYHNTGARKAWAAGDPALAEDHPNGMGAQTRLKFRQGAGPVSEIHAGLVYWSEDGAIQVPGTPEPPTQL